MKKQKFTYDVCLSFAGENRAYVEAVAFELKQAGIRVFYDKFEESTLWGKNLYEHLKYVYSELSRYCIIFVSPEYVEKVWTRHEHRSAQERAIKEKGEYILPAIMGDVDASEFFSTTGHIDLGKIERSHFVKIVVDKIMPEVLNEVQEFKEYVPPSIDRVINAFDLVNEDGKEPIENVSNAFFQAFRRMSANERLVVGTLLAEGCGLEAYEHVHMRVDLLRRITKFSTLKISRLLSDVNSLGFKAVFREIDGQDDVLLMWDAVVPGAEDFLSTITNYTFVAHVIMSLMRENYCDHHLYGMIRAANFMCLSSATNVQLRH